MSNKKFEQQLHQVDVPASLEKKLRDNWSAQLKEEKSQAYWGHVPALALSAAASVFVIFAALFVVGQQSAPNVVTLAMTDIASDAERGAQQTYRFDDVMRAQLKTRGINFPLPAMPVKMAKFCTLDSAQTVHLRIAGSVQGEVHLFIRDGAFDISAWKAQQGELNAMHWQVINPRDGLSVLVMRTVDMNQQNVEALIKKMFYA